MKIIISLDDDNGMDSQVSTIFGRCAYLMSYDSKNKKAVIQENPSKKASGGAGIQTAQWVIDQDADAVICGNLGPKAYSVLSAGGVAAYKHNSESIEKTLDAFNKCKLECLLAPSTEEHSGLA